MFGIFCPLDNSGSTGSSTFTIDSSKLPSKWGKILPGYGGYS